MICGSEMSGMASSGAVRSAQTLASAAITTAIQISVRRLSTASMVVVFMAHAGIASGFRGFELVFGIHEETAERYDFFTAFQAVQHLRMELPLQARVDL